MNRADRLAEALERINAIDGGEYPCAEIMLAREIAYNALTAYRSAPVDIERCARALYERIMFHSPLGWDNTAELFRERMREHVHAVLRAAGVSE